MPDILLHHVLREAELDGRELVGAALCRGGLCWNGSQVLFCQLLQHLCLHPQPIRLCVNRQVMWFQPHPA